VYLEMDLLESRPLHAEAHAAHLDALADRAHDANDRCGEAVARVVAGQARDLRGSEGSIDELEAMARNGIPLLDAAGDHEGLVRVWAVLSEIAHQRCLYGEAAQLAEQAILYARQLGRPAPSELRLLARALGRGPRPADQALQTLDRLLTDHPHLHSRVWRAYLLAMIGRLDEAWTEGRAASEQLRELGDSGASAATVLYEIATLAGEHEAAARHMRLCCDVMDRQGYRAQLSTAAPKLGRSLCALGRFDEAEQLAQQGRALGAEDDIITQALWRQVQARVLAHRRELEEAEQLAREAVEILARTDALNWQGDALCDLAEVLERAGQVAHAKAALGQALERYERKRNLVMAAQVRERIEAGCRSVPLA
jgi:tetratricopeptide (TPR) repeat protein